MQGHVKLPSGPLIGYWRFCQEIAKAVYPIDKNPTGIDCVWAKSYPSGVSSPYAGTDVPLPLDKADREEFAKVLQKLPPLKYPMSEEDVTSFMAAYVKLSDRPLWIPLLVKEAAEEMILKRKIEHNRIVDGHIQALREEHRAARLVPVNTMYIPVGAVDLGALLTRKDAIAYLERLGLVYDEEETETGPERDAASLPAVGGKEPTLKPGDHEKIAELHDQLKRERVSDPTARLARQFGVSDSMIRRVVKKEKDKKRQKASPFA